MNRKSQAVSDRRKRIKSILIENLGGQCCCCGYNRYDGALEFHHVNPEEKKFRFGLMVSKSLEAITNEIKKCILVCSICHKEIHAGIREIPKDAFRLTDTFVLTGWKKHIKTDKTYYDRCPICKKYKDIKRKYCCVKCSSIGKRKVERPSSSELKVLIENNTWTDIGRMYGVSDNTIRKWARKYCLIK